MKRNIVWITTVLAILLLGVAAAAKDNDDKICTQVNAAGTWGYTETGWVFTSATTAIPYASVGWLTVDHHGNVSGKRTASAAGTILTGTIVGTITVNPDCTGTLTQTLTEDPPSTKPPSQAEKAIVFVNNAQEAMMIVKGAGAVLTVAAKKVSPGHRDGDD